jgi:hypothetical protein
LPLLRPPEAGVEVGVDEDLGAGVLVGVPGSVVLVGTGVLGATGDAVRVDVPVGASDAVGLADGVAGGVKGDVGVGDTVAQ